MLKIIECVPNFSEGRDKRKIAQIVAEVRKVKGVKVLDVEPDADYHRTVVTFAGSPEAVKKAVLLMTQKAFELIDMTKHKGEHPRLGAVDVCPFVPISGVTMQDCIILANSVAKKVGETFKIPVYLYAEAAKIPEREDLSYIRQGEYEGLRLKLRKKSGKPDFGPAIFNPKSGAMIVGARFPLIAYNVNLRTKDKEVADRIAGIIRESGWIVTRPDGEKRRISGMFKAVKAMGVFLKEHGFCQASMNLTDYRVTPPHIVFETIKRISPGLAEVFGSEIVGLVPKEALLMAGRFYAPKEKSEERLIRAAIRNLGLNSFKRFNSRKKIIEYLI